MSNKNNAGFVHIVLVLVVLSLIGIAGFYFFSKQGLNPSISTTQTQKVVTDTSLWTQVVFSECGTSFKYPSTWKEKATRINQEKYKCDFMYWEPVAEGELQTNFVTIDVQPDKFMGKDNVKVDRNSPNVRFSELNGIEMIIENKENKGADGTMLKIRNIYLRKGTYFFRILTQYKDESSKVSQFADDIASTVAFTEDDAYYQGYSAEVEKYLGNWMNKNK